MFNPTFHVHVICPLIKFGVILQQPDAEKGKIDEMQEAERLAKVKASMTQEDLAELTRATEELRLKQETPDPPEALKAVPSLALSDIPKKSATVPIEVNDVTLISCATSIPC